MDLETFHVSNSDFHTPGLVRSRRVRVMFERDFIAVIFFQSANAAYALSVREDTSSWTPL